jgi:hypothetical protein
MTATPKPRRPFGVTLALVGGVFVFSLIPTLMIFVLAYLANYVQNDVEGGISGIEFTGGNFQPLLVPLVMALIYFGLAAWAWRGKPPVVRFVFPLVTALYCIVTWALLTIPQRTGPEVYDSASDMAQTASTVYIFVMIGATTYIAWFMNRWSARAFYRGYYTKRDLHLMQEAQVGGMPSQAPAGSLN